ncbi:GntR family transcriptional regulator [Paenibacillus oceani]|uniref:GntR family transcriptional regulator n=1 Tax=Paenibacillus oceani TaxID=2772510 RepID=A0A927C7D3_9BACL|nr:GntR family transcriptional regulator [Paenibacillus oceani]MBD2862560.1 GntR family transcriptional regulator [Paenibacillus oceani]
MSKFQFKSQENLSLRQKVAADIREAIIQGSLKPGEKLKEQEISEQMGISRGPIREALRDLEAMGLVTCLPYKETVVADVKREEIVDLLIPIRLRLELYSIKYNLDKYDAVFIDSLNETIVRMDRLAADNDIAGLVEEDILFHERILLWTESTYTQQIWSGIVNRLRLHFMKNTLHFPDLSRVPSDHRTLVDALVTKDLGVITSAWEKHIEDDDCLLYL